MAWNAADRYKLDMGGATDNAAALAHLQADLQELYAANKPLPKIVFPEGVCAFSSWPNLAFPYLQVVGEGMSILKHTGSGDAVTFEGDVTNPWGGVNGMEIGPFLISPNAQSGNGLSLKAWHRGYVKVQVMGTGVPQAGAAMHAAVNVQFSVCGELHVNVPAYLPMPDIQPLSFDCIGLYLGPLPPLDTQNYSTSGCYVPNPTCEIVSVGIMLDRAGGNHIYGGVCEGCNIGLQVQNNSGFNTFDKIDLEENKTWDIVTDAGAHSNTFSISGAPSHLKTNLSGWNNRLIHGALDGVFGM